MDVSVVVPTYKRPLLLERCLMALCSQNYNAGRYEIIVADDAASRSTERQVRTFSTTTPVRLVYVPVIGNHGPAAARNAGWNKAAAPIIAFTDDDCFPETDWLREGTAALSDGIAAVSGRLQMPLPKAPTDYELSASWLSQSEFVTANCFCRKKALEELGGFDEQFKIAWREDSDLQFRLIERGYPIAPAPKAVVVHPLRPAPWGVSLKQIRNNQFEALLYKKHPQLYRERIKPMRTPVYYLIVASFLTGLLFLGMGKPSPGFLAFSLWGGLTLGFCYKRLKETSHRLLHVAEMLVTSILIPPLSIYWRLRGAFRYRTLFY